MIPETSGIKFLKVYLVIIYIYIYIYQQKKRVPENTMRQPEQPTQEKRITTLPYIHSTSEMTARSVRQHNITVAHRPIYKLATIFTKHKDRTSTTDRRNAIYMFPCHDCAQQYIGEWSKKVETRLTEHRNAIKKHDPRSLPANREDEYEHNFDWSQTRKNRPVNL